MTASRLHLNTPKGSQYLQQLCKHFGHKVPVTFSPSEGRVTLPFGTGEMAASETELTITVQSQADDLARMECFVGDHLARFAFRENPTLTRQRSA
ncbi:DUF2218 domain-containing protein [Roseibaca sp. V10]|uniref:DUF2218 domain-containing protein n=1 Tax=Roseinatronobacter domitianus TaxID=2940293 RepID=A0ABT0M769_9RHOB|nr:DUF2218 domain-containing protein [Roseibaca domitiana]MCL1630250.1 DUF2218 domain-containing protein [Roseibaca domitiana]